MVLEQNRFILSTCYFETGRNYILVGILSLLSLTKIRVVWGEVQRGKVNRKVQRVTSLFLFRDLKLELKEGGRGKGKMKRKERESACT